MVNARDQFFSGKDDSGSHEWNSEEMAGNMILLGSNKIKQPVEVKVYRTSGEHFAVFYPVKRKVCSPLGVLNLKNTMVERLSSTSKQLFGFVLQHCGFDAPLNSLTFLSETGNELDRWIEAFTCRRRNSSSGQHHRQSSLPILEEGEEF